MSEIQVNGQTLPNPGTSNVTAVVNTAVTPIVPAKSNLDTIRDITPAGFYYIGLFDNKRRFIKFDLNAFAQMEIEFGSMETAEERLQKGTMADVRTVLWLGLIHDEAIFDEITGDVLKYGITKYQVGSWLTTLNLGEVMDKLQQAISSSLPEDSKTPDVADIVPVASDIPDPAEETESPN